MKLKTIHPDEELLQEYMTPSDDNKVRNFASAHFDYLMTLSHRYKANQNICH